jgi:menaquinone-dependent protoporphyrinogen oxidase
MSTLVTYATAKGSTRDIAQRIASRLENYSTSVDCLPIKEVQAKSLAKYSTVIIGSAIHMASWLSPARRFIHTNAATLKSKPVWAFSIGMPPQEADRVEEELMMERKVRKELPELRGHRLFLGRFYKQDLGWLLGWIFTCCVPESKTKWGDERNWEAIDAWADMVGKEMGGIGIGGSG